VSNSTSVFSWATAETLCVVVVAVACLAFQGWIPSTHVTDDDYRAAAAAVARAKQPGDVVLLAPWWTERARLFFDASIPVVGHLHSDNDAHVRAPRIWVLSQPNLPRNDLGTFYRRFSPDRSGLGEPQIFGNLRLELFQNGRARLVSFDAELALSSATVYLESPDGSRQACTQDTAQFRCTNGSAVLFEWREVLFAPERCLRLYPPGGAAKAVVEFRVSQAIAMLEMKAAYTWDRGTFREGVTATSVQLEAGSQSQGLNLAPGTEGFLGATANDVAAGTVVRVSTQAANAANREVCIQLIGYR
jgi:hypothetical protein